MEDWSEWTIGYYGWRKRHQQRHYDGPTRNDHGHRPTPLNFSRLWKKAEGISRLNDVPNNHSNDFIINNHASHHITSRVFFEEGNTWLDITTQQHCPGNHCRISRNWFSLCTIWCECSFHEWRDNKRRRDNKRWRHNKRLPMLWCSQVGFIAANSKSKRLRRD